MIASIPSNINTLDRLAAAQFYANTLGWADPSPAADPTGAIRRNAARSHFSKAGATTPPPTSPRIF